MATKTENVSQTNWPYMQKAAFWKEDKTAMKIVKFISCVTIFPLAALFLMDLVKKAHDYVWGPKKIEPVTSKNCCWGKAIKNGANAALTKVQNFWADHKKAIIVSASAAGLALVGYYLPYAGIKSFIGDKSFFFGKLTK